MAAWYPNGAQRSIDVKPRMCRLSNWLYQTPSPKSRPFQSHDGLIEGGKEVRAVAARERLRAAGDRAGGAQAIDQVAGGERHPDRGCGEGAAGRCNHLRAPLDAA